MSLKLLNGLFLGLILVFSMLITTTVFACDDKSCETAYLAETKQHIANQIRRANASKIERHAYSQNRERRAYGEFVLKYFVLVKNSVSQYL